MKDLKSLMGEDSSESDMKDAAKLKVLKHLKELASSMMGDDVKGGMEGLKKVTVAAPDKAGLQEGLDKAKELMGHDESSEDPMEESHESEEQEHEEDMSPDEIDAEIAHLMELKKQMEMKQ